MTVPQDVLFQRIHMVATGLQQAGRYDPPRARITVCSTSYDTMIEHLAEPVETLLSSLPTTPRGSIQQYMDTMVPKLKSYIPDNDARLSRVLALERVLDKDYAPVYDTNRFGKYALYTSAVTVLLHWAHDRQLLYPMLDMVSDRTNAVFAPVPGGTLEEQLQSAQHQFIGIQRWVQWSLLASVYDAMAQTEFRDETPWAWQEPMFCDHLMTALSKYLHDHRRLLFWARLVTDKESSDEKNNL